MRKIALWALLVSAPPLLAGAVLYGLGTARKPTRSAPQRAAHPHQVIPQPPHWIPFRADLTRVYERTGEVIVGRTYQAADGSTRSETGPSLDAINIIGINNIAARTFYLWQGENWWTAQPMELPPDGWRPFPRVLSRNMSASAEKIEGFDVFITKSGVRTTYEAPQLNFFPLITTIPCATTAVSRCGIWHSNVRLGEQRPELFRPPQGSQIIEKSQPGGIIKEASPIRR